MRLASLQVLKIEKEGLKRDPGHWAILDGIESDHLLRLVNIRPMTPPEARALFLAHYKKLTE